MVVPEELIDCSCPEELNMITDDEICSQHGVQMETKCRQCWITAIELNRKLVNGYKFALELEDDFFATISRRKNI